jgi:hypothetical protein
VPLRSEPKAQAVREFSVLVPGRTSEGGRQTPPVELRIVERTGEVHVAVRTADERLTGSLREDLGELVTQLAERGFRADTWHPGAVPAAGGSPKLDNAAASPGHDSAESGNPGRGGSDTTGRDPDQRRREQQTQPEWLEALGHSLGRGGASLRSIPR